MSGVDLIRVERERQIAEEGWTPAHDDVEHQSGELAAAAICYALAPFNDERTFGNGRTGRAPSMWPWDEEWWKPAYDPKVGKPSRVRELVKAGALIAAEIDRLQRAAS